VADLLLYATQGLFKVYNPSREATLKRVLEQGISPNVILSWANMPFDCLASRLPYEMSVWDRVLAVLFLSHYFDPGERMVVEQYLAHGANPNITLVYEGIPASEGATTDLDSSLEGRISLINNGRKISLPKIPTFISFDALPQELRTDSLAFADIFHYFWEKRWEGDRLYASEL